MNDDEDEDRNANDTCGEEGMFKSEIFVTFFASFLLYFAAVSHLCKSKESLNC